MLSDPACPVCRASDFEFLAERHYHKGEAPSQRPSIRLRYQVMFDVWMPGEDVFAITFVLCRCCGLVIYRPRPEAGDLERKYRFLTGREAPSRPKGWQRRIEAERADELLGALEPHLDPRHRRVLDYGGGDGRLMTSMIREWGLECALVDYVAEPVAGVEHLADTIEGVSNCMRFDVIVCSHVLEHLADPVSVLQRLKRHLDPKGILFAEVPLEVWGKVPAPVEPVTHVNFFTPLALRALLEISGYRILKCWTTTPRHPTGTFQPAVRAVAQAGAEARWRPVPENATATLRLMQSGLAATVRRVGKHPKLLLNWPLRARRRLWLALSR